MGARQATTVCWMPHRDSIAWEAPWPQTDGPPLNARMQFNERFTGSLAMTNTSGATMRMVLTAVLFFPCADRGWIRAGFD